MKKENFVYDSSERAIPSKEIFPNGAYIYIFYNSSKTVIISPISANIEHRYLTSTQFNPQTDDAGRFGLTWGMTLDEIEQRVNAFGSLPNFDAASYRKQLEQNSTTTEIKIEKNYGSDTLGYKPNPVTRLQFMNRLGQLFPSAKIFYGK